MKKTRFHRGILFGFVVFLLVLMAGGVWFFRSQRDVLRAEAEQDLAAISELKVAQIVSWQNDQLAEGREIMRNTFLIDGVSRWMKNRAGRDEKTIRETMQALVDHYGYHDILLVDTTGAIIWSYLRVQDRLESKAEAVLMEVLSNAEPQLSDLYRGESNKKIYISTVLPLVNAQRDTIGGLILQSNAEDFLYPLIQSWPMPSDSAETLLIRPDGDNVLFLNELRHMSDTALNLRIPLTETEVPAVMAVTGRTGVVEGLDYRGVPVIAYIAPIPDSPWFMIAKIDSDEALAVWRRSAVFILVGLLVLVVAATGVASAFWQRSEARHYFKVIQAEAARQHSEERYRTTLLSVGDGVIATDAEGRVELLNPVAEELTGWKESDAKGKHLDVVFRIINEETGKPARNTLDKVIREGRVVGLANHTILISTDGTQWPIADSGAPIRNSEGDVTGMVLVFRDQSMERAAQRALQESEARFRRAVIGAPFPAMIFAEDEELILVNNKWMELTGYIPEEIPTTSDWTEKAYGRRAGLEKSRIDLLYEQGERVEEGEHTIRTKNGGTIDWQFSSVPLGVSEDGKRLILSMAVDVTERKKLLAQYQNLFDSMLSGFAIHEMIFDEYGRPVDYRFLEVNPAFEKITGLEARNIIGKTVLEVLPDTEEEWIQKYGQITKTGNPLRFEQYSVEFNKYFEVAAFRTAENQFASIFTDVTERSEARHKLELHAGELEGIIAERTKELEKAQDEIIQKEKLATMGQLAGGVGHELRNPLGVINNAVHYLKAILPEDDEKTVEYLDVISDEIHKSSKIIADLLSFAKEETIPQKQPVSIAKLVTEVLQGHPAHENVRVDISISDELPLMDVDPHHIEQVLDNLITNAYQAMPDGGDLFISAREVGKKIKLEVKDTGVGIHTQNMEQLFKPLFTTKPRGIGLGLAISKKLVEANGGRIDVQSTEGSGTSFTLTLPIVKK